LFGKKKVLKIELGNVIILYDFLCIICHILGDIFILFFFKFDIFAPMFGMLYVIECFHYICKCF